MRPVKVDVAVVGGGIAGLATAYELHRRRVPFVLMERASRLGGVILSEEIDGFTIDAGPDSLLIQKPDGIKLCEEIGLGDRLVTTKPPRLAYVQRGGELHPLPARSVLGIPTELGPFVRTRLFSWPAKLRMGAEWFIPARQESTDESIGSFMRRRFGREATVYLAEPLLAGIHAGLIDRLSVRALFPKFVEAERQHGSLLRAFRHDRQRRMSERGAVSDGEGAFKSLPGGLSEMVRGLEKMLPGEALRVNAAVTRISGSGPYQVETRSEPISARAVVVAAPAYVSAALLAERDGELATLCGDIIYASTATVVMAFPRDGISHPLNGSGFVVPHVEGSPILAASWLSSKWPNRAPENRALLRTFHGGSRDPTALDQPDAALKAAALQAIRPLLGVTAEPLFSRVYRWEKASAQHEVGHLARVESIDRALLRHPGLFLTGSGFRGVGIPDCIADARATAAKVAAWLQADQFSRYKR